MERKGNKSIQWSGAMERVQSAAELAKCRTDWRSKCTFYQKVFLTQNVQIVSNNRAKGGG